MANPDPNGIVVCDAGPLIHLDELGCLDLLCDFADVLVPSVVWQEVKLHRPSVLRRRAVKLQLRNSLPDASPALTQLAGAFSRAAGELGALRLLQESSAGILLTDDAAA